MGVPVKNTILQLSASIKYSYNFIDNESGLFNLFTIRLMKL